MVIRQIKTSEGVVWTVIGLSICVLAWMFDLGSFSEPGPGFIAFISGLFMVSVGLIMIFLRALAIRSPKGGQEAGEGRLAIPWQRLMYIMGFLLFYILFLNLLGYMLATFFVMWGMSFDWEKKNWVASILFSVITVIISYIVFEVWLKCQLPHGLLPWW